MDEVAERTEPHGEEAVRAGIHHSSLIFTLGVRSFAAAQ